MRAYLYLLVFIPITALFALSASIFTLFDSSGRSYAFHARLWARFGLALNNTPVELRGAEHLPDGPFILMSNHQSNFDILALIATIPRRIYWIAKKELFDIPIFGPSMRRGGYIPLDRSDGRKALKSMENAAAIIRQGSSVVMFPEGTRSRDGQLLPFKRGGFMLAVQGRCAGHPGHDQRQRPGQSRGADQAVQREDNPYPPPADRHPGRDEKERGRGMADGKGAGGDCLRPGGLTCMQD